MNLALAKSVAQEVRKAVLESVSLENSGEKVYVGADGEATYRIDDLAEKAALAAMDGEPVAVLSEEAGLIFLDKKPEFLCVLDPLDGSSNAVAGLPFYCTSVAFAPWSKSATLQDVNGGVVVNLITGDLFEGEKGGGARLNGRVIMPSTKHSPLDITASLYLKTNFGIISSFSKVRAMGAVALELAHVASGGLDCLFDNRNHLKVTDVAAGMRIIEEAGGRVTDMEGNNLNQSITRLEKVTLLAAGNPELHKEILNGPMKK
jgi:myo-inositol-1(or 4)-monophosphatase